MRSAENGFGAVEIKAFVPARDFALSKRFYEELGFEIPWSDDTLAYMRLGDTAFFLQNFYVAEHASNFMMHPTVQDVESWWAGVQQAEFPAVMACAPLRRKTSRGASAILCCSSLPACSGASPRTSHETTSPQRLP